MIEQHIADRVRVDAFPRSAKYDPQWQLDNMMGPNALWLAESLSGLLRWEPGMRVLDLGCGRAMTSVFLAREFGLRVWAADLWVPPTENWERVREAGLADSVYPVHVEAHDMPFPHGFFDAIVSLDSYHYFGTDDLYLEYLLRFLRPGGQLGIVVPGLTEELSEVPEWLEPHFEPEFWSFHSPEWWRRHWSRWGTVDVHVADMLPDGWRHWLHWAEVCVEAQAGPRPDLTEREVPLLRADAGRTLGFARVVATKR
ncbi:SAM-dependent methyltransferase [Streptoalloteichus tenebrarius]|uniref:SAM-dependent methyltransferase n=1 Tax=Streptoalloteichus tenebrarius (strain ATCC 17920 / DSM 40477 / JCM 4838 / CBS 697.72 / NBRC 16177 / NCIMB 11028 / NRRL B-12390 / A12253. 1 / ISP 5477) TaxID=1933 RepID=UPI0020A2DD78|nr:methyltransferase domain-containing protein [Streptoalloteichus tenebrarius]